MCSFPLPSLVAGSCAQVPGAAYMQLLGARVGIKDVVLQISGICVLITDCCFWSWSCRHRAPVIIAYPLTFITASISPPTEATFCRFKGPVCFLIFISFLFFFFPLGSQVFRTFKRGFRKSLHISRERHKLKRPEDLKFSPQSDSQHRQATTFQKQKQAIKQNSKHCGSGGI